MSEPFLGQISIFGFNFPPKGWAFCQGQILSISQNTALFSLLGTTYGGNGQTTFALPNLQDRVANSFGQGPGLQSYDLGEVAGTPTVTLLATELAAHSHLFAANTNLGTVAASPNNQLGIGQGGTKANSYNAKIYSTQTGQATTALSPNAIGSSGQGSPHSNLQPFLTLNVCIAVAGIFPSRN